MTDLFRSTDHCCGLCRYWVKNTGEYSNAKRTCTNPQSGWNHAPRDYGDGVECGFWEIVQ